MDNFQLYRTNILLGGQMKWDLILESEQGELYIKDFHLTPISNIIPYNYKQDDNLLNYTHQENIKTYYMENSGYFYENIINPELDNNWIQKPIDVIYNDTVDMGCKRPKNYSVYKKQFEFFVPMWLEQVNDKLSFIISIYGINDNLISSKTLTLNPKNIKYHDEFVNYFNNYINYIGLFTGNEDVINISLKGKYANINGIEVTSGNVMTKQDLNIIDNLLLRERPLMENDNMITQMFKSNKMISKQLFNFNLCFNIEDILSTTLRNQMFGGNFKIKVETKIGDKKLPIKDFYTNYEYIPKKSLSKKQKKSPNVLSYLSDDKALPLIDKNKIKSNIIHWSLLGNNDYIFNLYDGFSAYIDDFNLTHLYDDTPDTNKYNYSKNLNNLSWANFKMNFTANDMKELYEDYEEFSKTQATIIKPGWINKLYFNYNGTDLEEVNVFLGICSKDSLANIKDSGLYKIAKDDFLNNKNIYYIDFHTADPASNLILFLTDNPNTLTYKSFSNTLKKYPTDGNKYILYINKVINSLKKLNIVVFNNSLTFKKAPSPNINESQEIEYIKNNNCPIIYVARYDGKIKPTFVSKYNDINFNYFYFRGENKKFEKYNNSGYEPLYKSLGYFSIEHDDKTDYNIPLYERTYKEFKWFNDGNIIILIPELILSFDITYNENNPAHTEKWLNEQIKKNIKNKFKSLYDISDNDEIEYIYSFYNYKIDFDYDIKHDLTFENDKPIYTYKYKINTILK